MLLRKKENLKPHNILIIESELDALSWKKILNQVSKGSDAMILAEEFPQEFTRHVRDRTPRFQLRRRKQYLSYRRKSAFTIVW